MSDTEYISKDAFVEKQRKQYCENCEKRKGTKNGKRIFVYEIGEAPCRACDIEDMIDAVWDYLPADAAPVVHGHWKREYHENDVYSIHFVCSNCRTCMETTRYERKCSLKFCLECGAKMDEREGNDE